MASQYAGAVRSIASVCAFLALFAAPCNGANATYCLSRGFTSNLMCSSCRELKQFGLDEIEAECLTCCQEDSASSEEKVRCKSLLNVINVMK